MQVRAGIKYDDGPAREVGHVLEAGEVARRTSKDFMFKQTSAL